MLWELHFGYYPVKQLIDSIFPQKAIINIGQNTKDTGWKGLKNYHKQADYKGEWAFERRG